MRKIGMAQIKNVLKIIKSKLGRFGQWLDEVYNPWMLRILVALTIAFVIFHVRNTIRTLTIEGYSKKIAWEYIGDSFIDIVYTFMLIVFIGSLFLLPFLYYLRKRYLRSLTSTSDMSSDSVEIETYKIDNNRLIPQVIDAIRTYDFRLVRAITAFEEALNIPYVDPELIHMHARRLRLIGAALGAKIEWLIRFMEGERPEVME